MSVGERPRGRWPESLLESQMLSSAIHTRASGDNKGIMRITQGGSHSEHLYMYVHVLVCVCVCACTYARTHYNGCSKLYQYDGSET